jgi:beta-glucosidase
MAGIGSFSYLDRSGEGLTDNGWEVVPEAFGSLLDEAGRHGWPLVVAENGIADASDARRASFLRRHAAEVVAAQRRGVDVSGYFHWSLVDNFEWLEGWEPRFGLAAVDRTTMARTLRPSAAAFREEGERFLAG